MTDSDRIRRALQFIPSDDRDTWVEMGMAVHSELGRSGFDIWNEWSQQAENYSSRAAESVWRSFKAGSITIASLFARAISAGYQHDAEYLAPSTEEIARREKQQLHRERQQAEGLAQRQKGYADASKRAAVMISQATIGTHPYLTEKGFKEATGLVSDHALLIPMRDCISNELLGVQSIQLIENEWEKKMLHGQRAKGAILKVGPGNASESVLVEGYATGLSVDAAVRVLKLNADVVVCFSAGNLSHVAGFIKGRRYAFADNDESGAGEAAAQKACIPYVMSDQIGEDANDLHRRSGIMAVAKKIVEARRM